MYGIELDRASSLSLVRQLCESLRSRILEGSIPAASRLPSSRILATELGVARNVVTVAYEQLEAEGYLQGRAGSGTMVTALGRLAGERGFHGSGARMSASRGASMDAGSGLRPLGDVVDFSSACGIPDIESFPFAAWKRCVAEAMDAASSRELSAADPRGDSGFRERVSDLLFRTRGLSCEPERIFATRGITHAFSLVSRFLRARTERAMLEDPMLNSFKRVLRLSGYRVDYLPADEDGLDPGSMPPGREPTLSVVAPSHQFPLGGILPVARRLELLAAVRERNGWIFEDDYDGELRLRGLPVPPLAGMDPERVFFASTFNKTMFPALGAGFVVAPGSLAEAFATFRLGISECAEAIPGRALASFIAGGQYERRTMRLKRLYSARRGRAASCVTALFGGAASLRGAEAGCHCRLDLGALAPEVKAWERAPGAGFKVPAVARYLSGPVSSAARFAGDVLLGYGNLDEERIGAGLSRLKAFLETMRQKKFLLPLASRNAAR